MRLQQHIDEGLGTNIPDVEYANMLIDDNCKQYLKLIKGNTPLYRGMDREINDIGYKKVRKNRIPFGMEPEQADALNKWLQKNRHSRRDKSVMATGDLDHTGIFGQPFMIFPIGRFKYTWFNGPDVNMDGHSGWTQDAIAAWYFIQHPERDSDGMATPYAEKAMALLDKPFDWFFTSNKLFNRAHKNSYEIWIECDDYYYADATEFIWDNNKQELVPDE